MSLKLQMLIALVFFWTVSFAQDKTITGTITSGTDSQPLPGVSVIVKGTTIGTVTNLDGIYSLKVPADQSTIVFSYIGFASQEVEIGSQTSINIALMEDVRQISEVVVTAFGIEREKKALGYATQEVGDEELSEARSNNVINSLSGKVAGVQISGSGVPGGGSSVVIRGSSSFGNNQPLYVIDGVPMDSYSPPADDPSTSVNETTSAVVSGGGISELNPDNIASISVLKGPNAAALYGSRAANGVILVTTKDGSGAGKMSVEFNSNVTWENPLVSPDFQNIYGGGNGYVSWYADGRNGGITGDAIDQFRAAYPNAPLVGTAGVDESWGAPMDGRLVRHWWSGEEVAPLVPVPDMWDNFWETGRTMTNNISISGAGEKGSFRLSAGHMDQSGIMYNNDFKRTNLKLNTTYKLTDKLTAKVSMSYIKSGSDNRQNPALWELQTWHHRHDDWGLLKDYEQFMDVHITRDGDEYPYANWQHSFAMNRFYQQEVLTNGNNKNRLLGNLSLNYKFNDNLSLMVRSGTDWWQDTRISVNRNWRTKSFVTRTEAFEEEVVNRQETNSDMILTFTKDFGKNFSFNSQLGGALRTNYAKRNFIRVNDMTINGVYNVANNATINTNESYIRENEVQSLFGSAQIGYQNMIFLDMTARNDWSSTLPVDNNSYFYPSVSLSAVMTDLLGINSSVLSFAKVRASWAQVGNDADPYQLQQVFTSQDAWNGSTPVFAENNTIANSGLKPETTTGIELGADFRFFNGKVGLDVTYYDQTTVDQILAVAISPTTGYGNKILNAGEINNNGVELMLYATPIETSSGFKWDVSVNYSKNSNKVVDLIDDLETLVLHSRRGLSLEARVGEPYGTFYGTAYERAPDGQIVFKDGIPQKADGQQVIGSAMPDWLGGVQNTVSYKNLSFSFLIDAKMGGDIADESTSTGMQTGVYPVTALGREEGVIGQGVKNIGTDENPVYVANDVVAPTKSVTRGMSVRTVNEGAIYDGSFIKLREMRLTYDVPSTLLSGMTKGFVKGARVSLVGRNVAMLWKNHPHVDPEINGRGGNLSGALIYAQVPSTRSMGFNVNFRF